MQASDRGRWCAIHARPRCEKKVAEFARACHIECYLPLLRKRKRYQRRKVESLLPMFPGYLFARLDQDEKKRLFESNRVARILQPEAERENRLIEELNNVRIVELAELEREIVVNPEIVPGRLVLIAEGPLKGCRGIVERRDNRARVTVNIELLGNSVSAALDLHEIDLEVD